MASTIFKATLYLCAINLLVLTACLLRQSYLAAIYNALILVLNVATCLANYRIKKLTVTPQEPRLIEARKK